MSDATIQVLEGMLGYSGVEEVSMVNGLDATISTRADPGLTGAAGDFWGANKMKILVGAGLLMAAFVGWRFWQARNLAQTNVAVAGMDGFPGRRAHRNRRRKAHRVARRTRRAA